MLPVVKGKPITRFQILLYTLVLVPLGVLPAFIGLGGLALSGRRRPASGLWLLREAIATWREKDEVKEPAGPSPVRRVAALYDGAVRRPDR